MHPLPPLPAIWSQFDAEESCFNDLAAFAVLGTIGGNLRFVGNRDLTALPPFVGLTGVTGSIIIQGNASLTTVDGFSNLATVRYRYFFEWRLGE